MCGVVGGVNDVHAIAFAGSCGLKIAVVMFGEAVVLGCPTTIAVAVCGVEGGVNNVRAIAFAGSCGLKIAVGEVLVLGCPTTIAVADGVIV